MRIILLFLGMLRRCIDHYRVLYYAVGIHEMTRAAVSRLKPDRSTQHRRRGALTRPVNEEQSANDAYLPP